MTSQESTQIIREVSEDERLLALYSYEILDTPRETRFDDLIKTLVDLLDVKYSKISFIDRDRIWYKSAVGIRVTESPRKGSIDDLLLSISGAPLIIRDITQDSRIWQSVYSDIDPNVRSFACVPIIVQGKYLIGCIAVIDTKIRDFTEKEIEAITRISRQIVELLEARREADTLHDAIRNQQEELRIKSTVERIIKTLTGSVNSLEKMEQAVQSFAQAVINEFGWWAAQVWFEKSDQMLPSNWVFSSLAPRSFNELNKSPNIYSPVSPADKNITSPFHVSPVKIHDISNFQWHPDYELLLRVGAREIIQVEITGAVNVAIRLLFVLPNQRALTARTNTALGMALSNIPQVIRRARAAEELNYRANHDELTGLLNRRGIDEQFPLKNYPDGSNADWTVFYLDLDKFKDVNDRFGHSIGDELLIEVANRIIQTSRPVDSVARLGGDEFVLIAQGFESDNAIRNLSNRILEHVNQPFTTSNGEVLNPKISIGISFWDGISSLGSAITRSDEMMYRAKGEGGNRAILNNERTTAAPALDFDFDIKSKVHKWKIFQNGSEDLVAIYFVTLLPNITAPSLIRELSDYLIQCTAEDGASSRRIMIEVPSIGRSERANVFHLFESLDRSADIDAFYYVIDAAAVTGESANIARSLKAETKSHFVISNFGTGSNELQLLSEFQPEFIKINSFETDPNTTVMKSAVAISNAFNIGLIAPQSYKTAFNNLLSTKELLYLINENHGEGENE